MAVLHNGDTVGDGKRLFLIVSDVYGGDAEAALKLFDDGAHLHAQLCVKVTQRLVHQQDARLDHERAGDGDALLLAAGQLVRLAVGEVRYLHQLQSLVHAGLYLLGRNLARLETVGDIIAHTQVREDGVVLEHHADVALVSGHVVDALVAEIEVAALDGVKARYHAQKRGLAAAGRAEQREEFALADVQRNAVECGEVAVALDGVLDDYLIAHVVSSVYV